MAKSVNKVILLGHVGKDPEIRSTTGGTLVANLSLATSERYKDQEERTEWHNLVVFSRGAEIIRDYVRKGSRLYVEGKIQTRSWDDKNSGEKKYRNGGCCARYNTADSAGKWQFQQWEWPCGENRRQVDVDVVRRARLPSMARSASRMMTSLLSGLKSCSVSRR